MSANMSYEKIWEELELPEFINGKIEKDEAPVCLSNPVLIIETLRRFQDLYNTIVNARFNFALSCADEYPRLLADNTKSNVLHIKGLFLNSAIIWYNNTFDHLLQIIWVSYELFQRKGVSSAITTENIDAILASCTYPKVIALGYELVPLSLMNEIKQLYGSKCYRLIRSWANIIKHRSCLEYTDINKREFVYVTLRCEDGQSVWEAFRSGNNEEYNSMKVKQNRMVSIKDVSKNLLDYHRMLISAIRHLYGCLYE